MIHLQFGLMGPWTPVPRFTGKTRISRKTADIPERPTNNREILIGASAKLLLINEYNIVQTGQGLGEMPQLQILTIISESVLLTCIRLYSGSVGSLAT